MTHSEVLGLLTEAVSASRRPHTVRVGLDGIDCAGKTTLADELVPLLEERGRPVIRASIDGFHFPRSHRYRYRHGPRLKRQTPSIAVPS